ncbi:MAG: GNAT family N-acetyltransferase [Proteobacteria bacterium]|nr:GNAT family N-acetyltransferase [Pseudomonadota bacterium]
MSYLIRRIKPEDNQRVKAIVVDTLKEFNISGDGYACVDPELENMFAAYNLPRSYYYVVELNDEIAGVGGIAPLEDSVDPDVAELRKMYFKSSLRGMGVGTELIQLCIEKAKEFQFKQIYLETVPEMKAAQKLYQNQGFRYIDQRMGATGHCGCGVLMLLDLTFPIN